MTTEIIANGTIIIPTAPTIMHHHAIFIPASSTFDCLIILRAFKPEMKAIREPMPPIQTIENTKPRDKSLLTLICNSRFGGICSLMLVISFDSEFQPYLWEALCLMLPQPQPPNARINRARIQRRDGQVLDERQ